MANASAEAQADLASMVREWAELYSRGFFETAQATLDIFGGGQSKDPRVAFLAACTQLSRLRYREAKESLQNASTQIAQHPEFTAKLTGGMFARLPEAIKTLRSALEQDLMPQLRGNPALFLMRPDRSNLSLVGEPGGGLGQYVPERPVYQAKSLVEAQQSSAGPPQTPPIPRLIEHIPIRDDSIVIVTDSLGQPKPAGQPETPPAERERITAFRKDLAQVLRDKNTTLQRIQGLLSSGDIGTGLALAQQAVSRFPQSSRVREALATVLDAAGRKDNAARTYLAAARLAATAGTMPGRLERCLDRSIDLAGENITLLREALAAAQRFKLDSLAKEALVRLLTVPTSITDPIQRQTWAHQLERFEPNNPLVRSVLQAEPQAAATRDALAAAEEESTVPELPPLVEMSSFGPMPPAAGVSPRAPAAPKSASAPAGLAPPAPAPQPWPKAPRPGTPAPPKPPVARSGTPSRPPAPVRPSGWGPRPMKPQRPPVVPSARPPVGAPVQPPEVAPPGSEPTRTRPPSAQEAAAATYPCFYCGKPVPSNAVVCPYCSHQQPAFLQRRVEQMHAAPEPTEPSRRSSSPFSGSPLTRKLVESQQAQNAMFLMAVAIALALFCWISGSKLAALGAIILTSNLEKKGTSSGEGMKGIARIVRAAAIFGGIVGLIRGGFY